MGSTYKGLHSQNTEGIGTMTVGRFNIMDMATIKISVNGKTQIVDMVGPTKLKNYGSEQLKVVEDGNEKTKELADGRRPGESAEGINPLA